MYVPLSVPPASQLKVAVSEVPGVPPHTFAPMGKWLGPEPGELLSSPMMFQVVGVTDVTAASAGVEISSWQHAVTVSASTRRSKKVLWLFTDCFFINQS